MLEYHWLYTRPSLAAQLVNNPPAMQETLVGFLGPEDPLEKGMAAHSSVQAWTLYNCTIPQIVYFTGLQRIGHDWATFPFCCFPLFLCTDRWGRLSHLSLLFSGALHSDAYIFPFLLGFSLLFFSQLFVRLPQTAILLFCISFPWGWSWSLSPVQCHEPHSIVHQALYQSDLGP